MIKRIPLPLSGVMLAFATLGNVLQAYHPVIRPACGVIAACLLLLLLLRLFGDFDGVKQDLSNPMILTTCATFDMGVMVLCTYIRPVLGSVATAIWFAALALHAGLLLAVLVKYIAKFDLKQVFASYFVPFVGAAVASVTAPAFGMQTVGRAVFWISLALYLFSFVLVTMRAVKLGAIPPPARPSWVIYAAPPALCLAGYLTSFADPSFALAMTLFIVTETFALIGYVLFFRTVKPAFFPTYAAYTFPYVISAFATSKMAAYLTAQRSGLASFTSLWANAKSVIAVAACLFVLTRYIMHIFTVPKAAPQPAVK